MDDRPPKSRHCGNRRIRSWCPCVLVLGFVFPRRAVTAAEAAPPPAPPVVPRPSSPPAAPAATREAELEARLKQMEATNRRLLEKLDAISGKFEDLSKRLDGIESKPGDPEEEDVQGLAPIGSNQPSGPEGTIGRGTEGTNTPGARAGAPAATGRSGRSASGELVGSGSARGPQGTISRKRNDKERPAKVTVGRGVRITTADDEFQLVFHDLTQAEYRDFPGAGDQSPLHSQFFVPRQRWYFTGRATKDVEFYTVINRGYGSLDLLDAFLDFKYFGKQFVTRVGRTKTPSSYEYYEVSEADLIAPERSIYTGNLAGNRQIGIMEHGRILDETAEYAVGIFNGPRRSFQSFDNNKLIFAFLNARPFEKSNIEALEALNIGGEYNFGNEKNPLPTDVLATANDQTAAIAAASSLSPIFFTFNNNVIEHGPREHWSTWVAWYYKSFNLLAQYDGGFIDYTTTNGTYRTRVANSGFFVEPYFFLTGEQIKRRVDVTPLRDFGIKNGRITGPGAIEVHARYSDFRIGQNVFTAGLADPNLWSNTAYAIDAGLNWYPNEYTKIYLDWQHSVFGQSVYNGPHALIRSVDLLWLRFQLFF